MWVVKGVAMSECMRIARETVSDHKKNGTLYSLHEYRQRIEAEATRLFQTMAPRVCSPKYANKGAALKFIELSKRAGECRDMRIIPCGKEIG